MGAGFARSPCVAELSGHTPSQGLPLQCSCHSAGAPGQRHCIGVPTPGGGASWVFRHPGSVSPHATLETIYTPPPLTPSSLGHHICAQRVTNAARSRSPAHCRPKSHTADPRRRGALTSSPTAPPSGRVSAGPGGGMRASRPPERHCPHPSCVSAPPLVRPAPAYRSMSR